MPLSEDAQAVQTSKDLVSALRTAAAGVDPRFRPAHARGTLITGTFTSSPNASTLSTAPHFNSRATPITVRFSSSTGLPTIPDTDPSANPRGFALRFHLGGRKHTDIIMHSTNSFPTHTGAEFLEFLKVAGSGDKAAVEEFLGRHPETKRFLETEKPSPESFTTERFWGVNAFIFVNGKGEKRAFRYQVLPAEEVKHLSPEEVKPKPENYLFDDISARLSSGQPAEFKLVAQLSEEGDVTDNATVLWPEEREIVELGTIKLEKEVETEESKKEQKYIIFDPIPRVEGIEPSADPLLETRANVYLVSGRERRAAA